MLSLRKTGAAILVAVVSLVSLASPVFAGSSGSKYLHVYNSINSVYTSLQHIAGAHDHWVSAHPNTCMHGQTHKWWVSKYHKDVDAVIAARQVLISVSAKTRRHTARTYADFAQAFTDLVHWMNGKVEPRVLTCRQIPGHSKRFEADLQTLQNDLGLIPYS